LNPCILGIIKQMDTSGETLMSSKKSKPVGNTQLSREELQTVLKFGAQHLFKQDPSDKDENGDSSTSTVQANKLEDLNLDEILSRAEHHTSEEATGAADGGAAFLEQWRVEDVAMTQLSWEEIIPEKDRVLEEEEGSLEYLGPRTVRQPVRYGPDGAKDDGGGAKKKRKKAGGTGKAKKEDGGSSGQISDKELRALLRAMFRFGSPKTRYDDIVADADLEDKDKAVVLAEAENILDACVAAQANQQEEIGKEEVAETGSEKPKSNRPPKMVVAVYRCLNSINSGLLLQRTKELDILASRMSAIKDPSKFRLGQSTKMPSWTCTWTPTDDSKLLIGVYIHGYGSWSKMQSDETLPFEDKFFLSKNEEDGDGDDDEDAKKEEGKKAVKDNRLPKGIHLNRRADVLLKLLREEMVGFF
jgi:chromodomain-helicase-DNA-binding protein 1